MPIHLDVSEYVQELQVTDNTDCWSIREFIGAAPILVKNPDTLVILVQSGRAMTMGNKHFMIAPAPLFPDTLSERKKISYKRLTALKYETTWTYSMWLTLEELTALNQQAATAWPMSPTFTVDP